MADNTLNSDIIRQVSFARRSVTALIATITVERLISAPTAGESTIPQADSTPAASGMAMTLYPVAQKGRLLPAEAE